MKPCIRCKQKKPLTEFHKHKKMKDGHLNKCRACVLKDVAEWRKKNPDYRKKEYAKKALKKGIKPRSEYLKGLKETAIGRKASALKYNHKRRMQVEVSCELTEFVFEEMCSLRELRKEATGFDWHIDHIVPLNHKKACGLHNYNNLQLVPAWWNVKKGNRNMNQWTLA